MRHQNTNASSIEAVLFDLDGTLLRVQMAEFIPRYIDGLAGHCLEYVKPKKFARAMLGAIRGLILVDGDGHMTNEQRIYATLVEQLSIPESVLRDAFQRFASEGLDSLQHLVQPIPLVRRVLSECRRLGVPVVLATNPVFPEYMIQARLQWGDLGDVSFALLTSFENSCYCKPHSGYFREIAAQLGVAAEKCLMVGNDTSHDLAAAAIGMQTFLVDTWIIERDATWPCDHRGDHAALHRFLQRQLVSN